MTSHHHHSSWQQAYPSDMWVYPGPASPLPTNQSQTRISQIWPIWERQLRRLVSKISDYCFKPLSCGIVSYISQSVQSLNRVWLFVTPWIAACQASLSITNSQSLPKLMSIEWVMPSNHLILCRPLLLLPPIPPSITVFSNESTLHMRWPNHWSFSFSISPSNEHPGLISFRMDWLDLLAVQGTLKSLLLTPQFKSINFSALSLLHSPTLTSIHDHWKNHSFD